MTKDLDTEKLLPFIPLKRFGTADEVAGNLILSIYQFTLFCAQICCMSCFRSFLDIFINFFIFRFLGLVKFLATDPAGSYMTGHCFNIDGGMAIGAT